MSIRKKTPLSRYYQMEIFIHQDNVDNHYKYSLYVDPYGELPRWPFINIDFHHSNRFKDEEYLIEFFDDCQRFFVNHLKGYNDIVIGIMSKDIIKPIYVLIEDIFDFLKLMKRYNTNISKEDIIRCLDGRDCKFRE